MKTGRKKLPEHLKKKKMGISVSVENYDNLQIEENLPSRIIDQLLTDYFKKKYKK